MFFSAATFVSFIDFKNCQKFAFKNVDYSGTMFMYFFFFVESWYIRLGFRVKRITFN